MQETFIFSKNVGKRLNRTTLCATIEYLVVLFFLKIIEKSIDILEVKCLARQTFFILGSHTKTIIGLNESKT